MNTNENRSIKVDSSDFSSDSEEDENTKLIMSAPVLSTESRRRLAAAGTYFTPFLVETPFNSTFVYFQVPITKTTSLTARPTKNSFLPYQHSNLMEAPDQPQPKQGPQTFQKSLFVEKEARLNDQLRLVVARVR